MQQVCIEAQEIQVACLNDGYRISNLRCGAGMTGHTASSRFPQCTALRRAVQPDVQEKTAVCAVSFLSQGTRSVLRGNFSARIKIFLTEDQFVNSCRADFSRCKQEK
jgi:hypothetical protein